MIGMCKVPLDSLATGNALQAKFPIGKIDAPHVVTGQLEVRLEVTAAEAAGPDNRILEAAAAFIYTQEFEKGIIEQIARKLAALTCEVSLMYGIFSQGRRNCTSKDFKHTCLHRLGLAHDGVTERELEVFFRNNAQLRGAETFEKEDFLNLFQAPIMAARNWRLNQQVASAEQAIPVNREQEDDEPSTAAARAASLQEREVKQILAQAIYLGVQYRITRDGQIEAAQGGRVSSKVIQEVMIREGIHEFDAKKVTKFLEIRGHINTRRLEDLFR